MFPNKFNANTETKYAKILVYADANGWSLENLKEQLNEKGITKIHQEYFEQEGAKSIKKLKEFTKMKTYSDSRNFIVLFRKTTATSVNNLAFHRFIVTPP